jgi:hypothetical protein
VLPLPAQPAAAAAGALRCSSGDTLRLLDVLPSPAGPAMLLPGLALMLW